MDELQFEQEKNKLEQNHNDKMQKIELQNLNEQYKEKEFDSLYKKPKKFETSKLLMGMLVFISFEIIVFAEYMMFKTQDLNALYALIGISATLTAGFFAYEHKSKAENIIKLQQQFNMDSEEEQSEG